MSMYLSVGCYTCTCPTFEVCVAAVSVCPFVFVCPTFICEHVFPLLSPRSQIIVDGSPYVVTIPGTNVARLVPGFENRSFRPDFRSLA